jgi:hypothetical protein
MDEIVRKIEKTRLDIKGFPLIKKRRNGLLKSTKIENTISWAILNPLKKHIRLIVKLQKNIMVNSGG